MIFFFMYKKHELIIGFIFRSKIFRHLRSFKKYSKNEMADSSRSLSPNKKKVKLSKMAGMATTKTAFKSEWKKNFLSSQAYQMML